MSDEITIGQLSERSGVPITTLRYYEKRGLIDPPRRVGGQRRFGPQVEMRLMVIKFCQSAGLTLDEILRVLNDRSPTREATREIAERRITAIDQQIVELQVAKLMMRSATKCRCRSVENCTCGAMEPAIEQLLAQLH